MNERIWHRVQKQWLEVVYYTPDDSLYYCVVKNPDVDGETFAVTRESVLFDVLNESLIAEIQQP